VNWQALVAGIGAILTGAGGCIILIREFRRRDRRALTRELDELGRDVMELRESLIVCRRYTFLLSEKLAEKGLGIPYPEEWEKDEDQ
jgi:hypothetical protein